jgi:pheromone shutdown protein TraB
MGHKVETLRQMYERCTPEEKRRPIEEVISELLFEPSPAPKPDVEVRPHWESLLQQLQKLSPADKKQLITALTQ